MHRSMIWALRREIEKEYKKKQQLVVTTSQIVGEWMTWRLIVWRHSDKTNITKKNYLYLMAIDRQLID